MIPRYGTLRRNADETTAKVCSDREVYMTGYPKDRKEKTNEIGWSTRRDDRWNNMR